MRSTTRTRLTLAGAALAVSSCVLMFGCPDGSATNPQRRDVILLSVDTLRADALSTFGDPRIPTEHMDRIGSEGVVFEKTVAPYSRTTQSVGSMLTGLHPLNHGADALNLPLPGEVVTIAERLSALGYETGAFVSNLMLRPGLGYEQGFDVYVNPRSRWAGNNADAIVDDALNWLSKPSTRPRFAWIHILDPHWPYEPHPDYENDLVPPERENARELWQRVNVDHEFTKGQVIFEADTLLSEREIERTLSRYDAEVAGTDRVIGRFLDGLEELGLWDEAIIAFTSDHGESRGDHRYWFAHGEFIYEDTLTVPWLIRANGLIEPGTRVAGTSLLLDIAPTILGFLGHSFDGRIDGVDLSKTVSSSTNPELSERTTVHLTDYHLVRDENPRHHIEGKAGRWWSLRRGCMKLIRVPLGDGSFDEELYDVCADPSEISNLVAARPEQVVELNNVLEQWIETEVRAIGTPAEGSDPMDQREMLRDLGYVN